jgi:hypothetical protein
MAARDALLRRAEAAGLANHETIQRLAFLQRVLACVSKWFGGQAPAGTAETLLADAKRYQLEGNDAVKLLAAQWELELLVQQGASPIGSDGQGRAVYVRCPAEFKNKPGQLEVRADGLTFRGEVLIDIAWNNVVHAAKTTHTYQGLDYRAIALQENKRRTPTKFALTERHRDVFALEVTMALWEQSRGPGSPERRTS